MSHVGLPRPDPRGRRHWKKLRRVVLAQNPICEWCKNGIAQEVDHVVPLSEGGAEYDRSNLQALCVPCHRIKSTKEARRRWKGR